MIQTDALPETHASVVCQMRGLRVPSQVMVDKPATIRRRRIGLIIGHFDPEKIRRLNTALAFMMGLVD